MSLFNWQAPDTTETAQLVLPAYQLDPSDLLGSRRDKVRGNLKAVQTLRALDDGVPTPEQQLALARYQGWGLCAEVFLSPPPSEWRTEAEQLAQLLTPEEYAVARNSVNTAFYTPPQLIQFMFRLLQHLGFEGGTVLEPGYEPFTQNL